MICRNNEILDTVLQPRVATTGGSRACDGFRVLEPDAAQVLIAAGSSFRFNGLLLLRTWVLRAQGPRQGKLPGWAGRVPRAAR